MCLLLLDPPESNTLRILKAATIKGKGSELKINTQLSVINVFSKFLILLFLLVKLLKISSLRKKSLIFKVIFK